ncbi:uncharacterized protein LOC135224043 isoform X2 [Macrobrachium nipponense]|uniref:uncharacterized protein LOC135224043 isoform X2 n=1 Tax=Macrobrachium nipponense TaxID=159736 RepID=UPI0030C8CDB9
MLGGCVAVPVRLLLSPPLLLCTIHALTALVLLPSASQGHVLPQEEAEVSSAFRSLLPRVPLIRDDDSLATNDFLSDDDGSIELMLMGARLFSTPFSNSLQQRLSSPTLRLSRPPPTLKSIKQLRPYYVDMSESPRKRQKRLVGKKFGGYSWPRSLEATRRRTNYLFEDVDQNADDYRFL